ncbi:MAG TPA: CBS domain-containing protein [Steroidobacteraceae bacterium]|nr:CBS domain-containing protein [Steroidobacteraceae bacterium]
MLVGTLCSRRPLTVSTGAPMSDVARLMRDERIGAVIVTDRARGGPRVIGMITDRDIVRAQLERAADLSRLSAGDVMTRDPLVIGEEESVGGAIAHLRARGVRRAPVIALDGTLLGLISADDLLANVARKVIGLAEIVGGQRRIERD